MDNNTRKLRKMEKRKLCITDFTEYPGPRYKEQGESSGEEFYVKVLNEKFYTCYKEDCLLVIYLDGTAGYPSSFLDEAFGELIYDFSEKIVQKHLYFETIFNKKREEKLKSETYPQWEARRNKEDSVKNTMHDIRLYHIDLNGNDSYREL